MPDKRYLRKLESVSEQIIIGYGKGLTLSDIAETHGVSIGTVRNLLQAHRVDRRPRGPKMSEEEELTEEYRKSLKGEQ